MKLTWYGHSCFLVETAEGSAVFDPYSPGSVPGLVLPALTADAVFCSHGHRDHNYAQGVRLTGRELTMGVQQFACFHDEQRGALRGENRITVLEAEGLRLAHLGDLGHMLGPEQIRELGRIDILLIPVGGHYTIDAQTAAALVKALRPGIAVPMHYRGAGFGYDVIGPVEDFTRLCGPVLTLDANVLRPEEIETPATVLLRCPAEK